MQAVDALKCYAFGVCVEYCKLNLWLRRSLFGLQLFNLKVYCMFSFTQVIVVWCFSIFFTWGRTEGRNSLSQLFILGTMHHCSCCVAEPDISLVSGPCEWWMFVLWLPHMYCASTNLCLYYTAYWMLTLISQIYLVYFLGALFQEYCISFECIIATYCTNFVHWPKYPVKNPWTWLPRV